MKLKIFNNKILVKKLIELMLLLLNVDTTNSDKLFIFNFFIITSSRTRMLDEFIYDLIYWVAPKRYLFILLFRLVIIYWFLLNSSTKSGQFKISISSYDTLESVYPFHWIKYSNFQWYFFISIYSLLHILLPHLLKLVIQVSFFFSFYYYYYFFLFFFYNYLFCKNYILI